jgi:hypothetical protein
MFSFVSLLLVLVSAATLGPNRVRQETAAVTELTRLEKVWNDAHLRGDALAFDKLSDADLFMTLPDMPTLNKEDALALWKAGKMKFDVYRTSDIRIRVYGNSAVVTGQLVRIRDATSKEFEDDWRFTKVYVRRRGRWLVVTWHGSHLGTS